MQRMLTAFTAARTVDTSENEGCDGASAREPVVSFVPSVIGVTAVTVAPNWSAGDS